MSKVLLFLLILAPLLTFSQQLKVKDRKPELPKGAEFAAMISDSNLTLQERERSIYKQVRKGNIPPFYRKLIRVTDSSVVAGRLARIEYFVLPDYLAIGSDEDYFYCPMSPMLAQKIAHLFRCSLPTRKMVDQIFNAADVKLTPQPIPPSPAMTTVPVFLQHNQLVGEERDRQVNDSLIGRLVAGNKKDVVVSNRMYKDEKLRVVIYGWHRKKGDPIQPLYNGHKPDWVDYSCGIRLIQNRVRVNGRRTTVRKVLRSPTLHPLLSDEGIITFLNYPKKQKALN